MMEGCARNLAVQSLPKTTLISILGVWLTRLWDTRACNRGQSYCSQTWFKHQRFVPRPSHGYAHPLYCDLNLWYGYLGVPAASLLLVRMYPYTSGTFKTRLFLAKQDCFWLRTFKTRLFLAFRFHQSHAPLSMTPNTNIAPEPRRLLQAATAQRKQNHRRGNKHGKRSNRRKPLQRLPHGTADTGYAPALRCAAPPPCSLTAS
jgi:hypothetical protein